ncbi:acyl-CoA thioesterase [Subsaximicrobium wynnwilliamsii]|jgi:acyl-CoA thioester hydrolase|uniref:Acyl-CoA thioesterase n=1 Tax=Subsaximicrobium wynnwilliamsii TaxID=291179 RepID=A0A5C6ZMZ7_9FLAO|nr:thioesterase family protein [Subsaximicrobium wynnwilliamsii]TXD85176.1 acyl-CoA thioesterase [Subsaximicrobium wynnwilliamsii]TXD91219.1 acyl-CoA thioesterase [Subsaximicrobium wynnwilliamsii]TXE04612.1 acyl-CoA thioesterase [Subsaximicrobium wynnwilliamsii]
MSKLRKHDEIQFRVRYGETDQMGVVYHGNYAQYFEMGRTEWLRKFGFSYKQMEADGIMLPVISLTVKFKKPARYDDLIKVKTEVVKKPSARIEFTYEISNEADEILTTGTSELVFMDMVKNRPTRCPKYILDQLPF